MPGVAHANRNRLPGRLAELVSLMAPLAIRGDVQYENTLQMIDRLMASGRLTKGQEIYLETLVQLIQAYEAESHPVEGRDLTGVEVIRHLLAESGMNASDLARLLGMHPSMGSKLLNGDRSLTIPHIKRLARHFQVRPELFLD